VLWGEGVDHHPIGHRLHALGEIVCEDAAGKPSYLKCRPRDRECRRHLVPNKEGEDERDDVQKPADGPHEPPPDRGPRVSKETKDDLLLASSLLPCGQFADDGVQVPDTVSEPLCKKYFSKSNDAPRDEEERERDGRNECQKRYSQP